jgi:hypothetical protein
MSLFVPTPETAARIAEEFREEPLTIEDLCDQVLTRIEIADTLCGRMAVTPRRIVRTVFDVVAARSRHRLPPYPETVVRSVIWLLSRP